MTVLNKKDKISIFGNLRIQDIKNRKEKNICIAIENKNVQSIGDYLYEFLEQQYEKYNYDWFNISRKIKTTKIIVEDKMLDAKSSFSLYGYVEDWRGLPEENGKKYDFKIKDLSIEELLSELENLYDNYICDFDTIKSGLKFIIEKIEIN